MLQSEVLVAPAGVPVNVPARASAQALAPLAVLKLPAGHAWAALAPVTPTKEPGKASSHEELPAVLENRPTAQSS